MPTPKILRGIERSRGYYEQNRALFDRLVAEGQAPQVLWIGCSDSRIVPELITGAEPGDLFVVRNVANVVPPYGTGETSAGAAIEYAIRHLHVPHAVICGHTDCGGIKALGAPLDLGHEPHIVRWVEHARPAATKVEAAGWPEEARHLAIVRENVLLQMDHLRSYDPVRAAGRAGRLTLHGWVYHLESGEIERYDTGTSRWVPLHPIT
ncbi:MAG: carbonic anhydrase [Anaerolineae bacterium]|nr:carbonic anhydrase [Anaerolineae bacterium]